MLKKQIKFTYTDYINLKDSKRYELIEGELYMVPSPSFYHQSVLGNLWDYLRTNTKKKRLGIVLSTPIHVVLTENDVVQPDILFISNENSGIVTEQNVKGAPDLIVEILSSGTLERDKIVKKYLYEKHGVKEYWIVEPVGKFIEVLTLEKGGFEFFGTFFLADDLDSLVLKKLRIPVRKIFKNA